MSTATLDRLLFGLVAAQLVTGLLTLRAGVPATASLFWVHGILGGCLLAAVAVKLARSVGPALRARRWGRLAVAGIVTLLAAVALGGGLVWVASGRILTLGPWTLLTVHVIAALALVPILAAHLLPRRWRVLRPRSRPTGRAPGGSRLSRRAVLAMGVLGIAGVATWAATNLADRLQGGVRRFTGSRWLPDGGAPPPTTFLGDATQSIDAVRWRLRVRGAVSRSLELDLDGLRALGEEERSAILDCTSGWVHRTTWGGVPMPTLLAAAGADPGARSVRVRSVTGWMVALSVEEANGTLLATSVAGQPLAAGNGAPCRLVAPRRRGFDWVKWIDEVVVS